MSARHVLIDPWILLIPPTETPDDVLRYFSFISAWSGAWMAHPTMFCTSHAVVSAAIATGGYPDYKSLARLIGQFQIEEFAAYDLVNCLRVLFCQQPHLEDKVGVTDVLIEDEHSVLPDVLLLRLPPHLVQPALRSLFIFSLASIDIFDGCNLYYATNSIGLSDETALTAAGVIEFAEGVRELAYSYPIKINQEIELLFSPFPSDVPSLDDCCLDPVSATSWAHSQLPDALRQVKLTPVTCSLMFIPSITQKGLQHKRTIMRRLYYLAAMAAIGRIAEVSGAALHPVRASAAADAKQVVRTDNAKLWRCKLAQHGAGYRLHFWTLPKGGIELDEVLVESEV